MNLTAREEQIMSLLATGMQDKTIAHCTGISVRTVQTHLMRIYTKARVKNRSGAILKYLDLKGALPLAVKILTDREI